MDLEKVEQFNTKVSSITNELKELKNRVKVTKRMKNLQFYATPSNDLTSCSFNLPFDSTNEDLKNILEIAKTLMLNTLAKQIDKKETELEELIKKGITDND